MKLAALNDIESPLLRILSLFLNRHITGDEAMTRLLLLGYPVDVAREMIRLYEDEEE